VNAPPFPFFLSSYPIPPSIVARMCFIIAFASTIVDSSTSVEAPGIPIMSVTK
jgi:hypothetical protein